nr:hypothetical protein [Tanacetum cinerariifolium]
MIQIKEMMQDKDLKNSKLKDEGSRSRSQSMNDQIHYKQEKTKTKINKLWDTMCFNLSTGLYSCQLDKKWFNPHKDILRDALDITPTNDNNPFVALPLSDTVIEYVNTLGYPSTLRKVSAIFNIDYAEKIWEEFVQSIKNFLTYRKNLATDSHGKKKTTHLLISSIRYVRKDGKEVFGMSIPDALLTGEIKRAPYYGEYQEHALELSLKEQAERTQGPAHPVVIREPDSGRFQSLPVVQGKGKEKAIEEKAAHDLLILQNPKNKSHVDQFIFQRRTSMPAKAFGPPESPSLDAKLALMDSETESNNEVPKINTRDQDEGQAGPNHGIQDEGQAGPNHGVQDEGQAGSNPGDAKGSQPQSSHVVPVRPNLKPIDLEATDASHLQNPEKLDEEFTTTAYLNVQENLQLPSEDLVIPEEPASSTGTLSSLQNLEKELSFTDQLFMKKQQEEKPGKTNAEAERIDELEQRMVNFLQCNLALEERLDKHGSRLYKLENLNIPHQEILQQRMFKDKSYEAHEDHKKLYDALEKSLECDYSDQLLSDVKEAYDSIPDKQVHLSDDEDSRNDHLPTADLRKGWWKPLPAEKRPMTPEPTWTIPFSNVSDVKNNWAIALALTDETPAKNSLLAKTGDMTNFLNWYCHQVNKTKLTQAGLEGQALTGRIQKEIKSELMSTDHCLLVVLQVISHMRILSVVRIKAYSRYGYDYLSEIVLRIVDLQEHTIAEKDFKNMHPSDFEDLNLLLLQGHLYHLPGSNKKMLSTAFKLWTQNLVIRQRVEDFQLGIESYQTQLNLTKPGWDATGYEFKHDYTIIESPRAVEFLVNNNERKIMRFNEICKFSDGMLTQILEALAYRVKEFKIK